MVYATPYSEPAAPPPAPRAPAPAAKRRKTAASSKDKSYLPSRGSANYAFLVCLLEVRPHPPLACPAGLAVIICMLSPALHAPWRSPHRGESSSSEAACGC